MDALDRLYFELVENVRREHRAALREPVRIADLQGRLIPYRRVRDAVDFRSNDEYAATLSRLLAGEREYLIVDPVVREDLRRALNDPLPDIRRYRSYPDAQVLLNPDTIPPPGDIRYAPPEVRDLAAHALSAQMSEAAHADTDGPDGDATGPEAGEVAAGTPGQAHAEEQDEPGTATGGDAEAGDETAASAAEEGPTDMCPGCGEETPGDAAFCPFCGRRLGVARCPDCGVDLKAEWRYCPGCGLER